SSWQLTSLLADQRVVAVAPDGCWRLATNLQRSALTVWNTADSSPAGTIKAGYFNAAAISPDCQTFAALGPPGLFELHKYPDGGLLRKLPLAEHEQAGLVAFSG